MLWPKRGQNGTGQNGTGQNGTGQNGTDAFSMRLHATAGYFTFMPRRARFIVPGVAHHVTQRGNNRQQVFYSPEDRQFYLALLTRHSRRNGTHIAGYCLMTNHVHLVVIQRAQTITSYFSRSP